MPLNKKGKKIKRAMTKQYGKKKGEKVFYAMENSGKLRKVTKARGGMDASQPDFGTSAPSPGATGGEGGYSPKSTGQYGQRGSSPSSTGGPNAQVKARKGPTQINMPQALRYVFPTTSAALYGFNALSRNLYNQRNLKEQREKDLLGGEMLTTRKSKPVISTGDGGDGQIIKKPIIPGPVTVNQPILPLSQRRTASVSPTGRFNYALKKGGMLIKGKPRLTKKGWK